MSIEHRSVTPKATEFGPYREGSTNPPSTAGGGAASYSENKLGLLDLPTCVLKPSSLLFPEHARFVSDCLPQVF